MRNNVRLPILYEQHTLLLQFLPHILSLSVSGRDVWTINTQTKSCGELCHWSCLIWASESKEHQSGQKEIKIYKIIP